MERVSDGRVYPTVDDRRFLEFTALLLGTLLGFAVAESAERQERTTAVTFTKDIAPILQRSVRRAIARATSRRCRC